MTRVFKEFSNRSFSDRITMGLGLLMAAGVSPILIVRILENNTPMIVFDTILVVIGLLVTFLVYKNVYVEELKFTLGVSIVTGMIGTSAYGDEVNLYWIYPGAIGIFFMMQARLALFLMSCMLVVLFPLLVDKVTLKEVLTLYASLIPSILFIFYFSKEFRTQHNLLNLQATEDFLTNAGNRRAFHMDAERCVESIRRQGHYSTLILFDMDHFKRLNDTFGHITGDKVLKETTRLVHARLRRTDKLYRLGGEEFAILMPGSDLEEALRLAEDLQVFIAKNKNSELPDYTVSFGIAQLSAEDNIEQWLKQADEALYRSKADGRDKITVFDESRVYR